VAETILVPRAARLALALAAVAAAPSAYGEDPKLRAFLRTAIGFTEAQITAAERGEVVTRQLPTTDRPEMAAFGIVRVAADRQSFLARFKDLTSFRKSPSVVEIGRFRRPPQVADLSGLTLDEGDFEAARECRPGRCDIKLARSAMERIQREMDWKAQDARARAAALMKQMLVEFLAAYLEGGTAAMATYADKEKPQETPAEFRKLLAASPYLVEYAPEFHRYVEDFPAGPLAGTEDLFYWTKDEFAPKPTISVYHVTIWEDPKDPARAVISSKQIYASHYFQAGLDLTALVAAPPGGFYLMDLHRVRIDPPTGMLSGVILGKIRGGIERGVAEGLKAAKARAEAR
jgi:hypothetical protein